MKLSAALIAVAVASPMGNWGGQGRGSGRPGRPKQWNPKLTTPDSGSPGSGSPKSPKSPKFAIDSDSPRSPHSARSMSHSGHYKDMEEEYKEFADMMYKGNKGGNINAMNINFAPVNTNMQNFVDINTEVDTDINVNSNGKHGNYRPDSGSHYSGRPHSGRPHSGPAWSPDYHHGNNAWKDELMHLLGQVQQMPEQDIMRWIKEWWNYVEPILEDPDKLCPMFNLIIKESWGMGSGKDWEEGCRRDMERNHEFEELFMNMWRWDTPTFASKFCHQVGMNTMEDLEIYHGTTEYHGYVIHAEPMCNCIVVNVKNTVEGYWSRPDFMQCAGTIADYADGIMVHWGDHGYEGDFSDENIDRVLGEIRDDFDDVEFNPDQMRLMELWDDTGYWKDNGILDGDRNTKLRALASSVIWMEANKPEKLFDGMNAAETLVHLMMDADLWIEFYENNLDMAALIEGKGDLNIDQIVDHYKSYGPEHYMEILGDPRDIAEWIQLNLPKPEDDEFIKKVEFFAGGRNDFESVYSNIYYNDHEMKPFVDIQNYYMDHILNREEPVEPSVMMAIVKCIEMDLVQKWIDQNTNEQIVRAEIEQLFQNGQNQKFMNCFNSIV